jgi:hypothetical protein
MPRGSEEKDFNKPTQYGGRVDQWICFLGSCNDSSYVNVKEVNVEKES